jgi:hypothetical protein
MRILSPAALLPLIVLAGCSAAGVSNPTVADPTDVVAIVDSVPASGQVISDINIVLCQATAADKPHTVEEAMRALKLSAKQHGAVGLANVSSGIVTTPTSKCVTMAQAMGIAYK